MKDAEEYIDLSKLAFKSNLLVNEIVQNWIKQAQTDAWNEALDKAADNITYIKESFIDKDGLWDYRDTIEIDKNSILTLKI